MKDSKKTPLFEAHKKQNATMSAFGEWSMPLYYQGVLAEHHLVRESVGFFDVSHMGELSIQGSQALEFLQYISINDVAKLSVGQGQYSCFCNDLGGIVDDLIIYRLAENDYLVCVNASNTQKDYQWALKQSERFSDLTVKNTSDNWGQIAVQGPHSLKLLQSIFPKDELESLAYMKIKPTSLNEHSCLIAQTGYTGEKGYEIYLPTEATLSMWEQLCRLSKNHNGGPCGLGARDTLRLEACFLLYGNDINEETTPLEAGIGWALKLEKKDFIGKKWLLEQKKQGKRKKLVAFKMIDPGIARHGMEIQQGDTKVGFVTSGSVLPSVGGAGGLAMINCETDTQEKLYIDIRGKQKVAKVVKRPLYNSRANL